MRIRRLFAVILASLFAATAVACASVPEDQSSRDDEREVPNGYF